jgi:predicted dehydrogenase
MTLGYHTLDLVAWCLGDITEISALSAAAYSGKGETQIVAIGRSGGGLVSMSMGVGANSTAPDEIIFDFERGRVVWCGDELIINGVVTHARSSNASLHNEQIGALVASIADRRPIGITLGESLKTLEVIERIYEASGIQGAENGI